ncbi:MAG: NAD(P)/FAD-dependent oxidoreductase [Actinomycetaceae bacterium]|nr:NAD(P)/FAD-dependent oxidoreductase [Actinomycetaceae bacterium]
MAQVVVLGAGIAGHTAALYLSKLLKKKDGHKVIVVSPRPTYNWIPSNIWVGTGKMDRKKVVYKLAPIYKKVGVDFRQAFARNIFPEGSADSVRPYVEIESTLPGHEGEIEKVEYDFLVNATGPKLNFAATPGLGPSEGNTTSVCSDLHAVDAWEKLQKIIERAKKGEKLRVISGTGHGTCTCEGAAFEYTFNMDHELREAGVRDNVEVVYMTNEAELGDLGVGGMVFKQDGYETTSRVWTESLFRERDIHALTGCAPTKVEEGKVTYEDLEGDTHELSFDFAMLLPPFKGQDLKAFDKNGEDITSKVFNPAGFMKVDADYSGKPYEEWAPEDWPRTYQNQDYKNMFAAGIAFAPPHQISRPRKNKNGTVIAPAPPRTGMPSGVIARSVAMSIADLVKNPNAKLHTAAMTEISATCVASTGNSLFDGTAAAMVMDPIIPNPSLHKNKGHRHPTRTRGEIGLFGHWEKLLIHYAFVYKAKALPGWSLIPE